MRNVTDRGMTLIEVVVSLMLAMLVILFLSNAFVNAQRGLQNAAIGLDIHERARIIMEKFVHDVECSHPAAAWDRIDQHNLVMLTSIPNPVTSYFDSDLTWVRWHYDPTEKSLIRNQLDADAMNLSRISNDTPDFVSKLDQSRANVASDFKNWQIFTYPGVYLNDGYAERADAMDDMYIRDVTITTESTGAAPPLGTMFRVETATPDVEAALAPVGAVPELVEIEFEMSNARPGMDKAEAQAAGFLWHSFRQCARVPRPLPY